jgi:hypothetical protein
MVLAVVRAEPKASQVGQEVGWFEAVHRKNKEAFGNPAMVDALLWKGAGPVTFVPEGTSCADGDYEVLTLAAAEQGRPKRAAFFNISFDEIEPGTRYRYLAVAKPYPPTGGTLILGGTKGVVERSGDSAKWAVTEGTAQDDDGGIDESLDRIRKERARFDGGRAVRPPQE